MQVSENVLYNCVSQLLVCRQALACGKLLSVKRTFTTKGLFFFTNAGKMRFQG
jgi:hypothetical protein